MSPIKSIRTVNIQSHEDVFIEMPETGLVVLAGDNSNGKSVITKVLEDVIFYNISNIKARKGLIRREGNSGYLEIKKYDGSELKVNLDLEASRTWAQLTRANGEVVTRYLADKTIPELVREFGFHMNVDRGISLNISNADDSILFFRTKHVANGDILNTALCDMDAQNKYEVLKEQYANASLMKQKFQEQARVDTIARDSLEMCDIDKEKEKVDAAYELMVRLESCYVPDIVEIKPIPQVLFLELPPCKICKIDLQYILDLPMLAIPDMRRDQTEYSSYLKGECPTCHRPYCLCQTCTNEIMTSAV